MPKAPRLKAIRRFGTPLPGLTRKQADERMFPPGQHGARLKRQRKSAYRERLEKKQKLRLHYARTLEHWLGRFERNAERVEEMFDVNFTRAWRLYLGGSIAAFTAGTLQLFQVAFARDANNDLPWSREHLYQSENS